MDASYFEFLVLALGVLVFILAALVYYFARKEERGRNRTKKLIESYFSEKAKEQGHVNRELAKLKSLLENNSIDRDTHERMKNLLITTHKEKRTETENLIDYVKSKKKPAKPKPTS
jgi:uncharacterized membrane protein YhiD involved in acid resistance